MSKTHRIGILGVLVLVLLLGLLLAAGPALADWPMWGNPPMPFGGQPPTVIDAYPLEGGDPYTNPLDWGTEFENRPLPGDWLMLGWSFASYIDATAGPWADRFDGYALTRWNYIYREFSEAGYYGNTHWGTALYTSVDPTPYWPGLPPRSTWRWKGSFQGVTFMASGEGLHSIQQEMVGCNQNRGLKAYVTYYFYDLPHGQVFVVPAWRTCTD